MSGQDLPDGVEKDKLHMGNPMGINDDIESIIEDEIK